MTVHTLSLHAFSTYAAGEQATLVKTVKVSSGLQGQLG